jgi:phosphoglycolate phosphatase
MAQNFIFDLDGTLVDSLPGIEYAVDAALSQLHRRRTVQDLRTVIGPPIRSILQTITDATGEDELDELERLFRKSYDTAGWRKTTCYPGARELLHSLYVNGNRLFLLTNKPLHVTNEIVAMFALRGYFEDVLTPDSRDPFFRDKSEMFRCLMQRHDLAASETLMIGDTAEDYVTAAGSGVPAAIVAHGYGTARIAAEFPHCRVIREFSQITADYSYSRSAQ